MKKRKTGAALPGSFLTVRYKSIMSEAMNPARNTVIIKIRSVSDTENGITEDISLSGKVTILYIFDV